MAETPKTPVPKRRALTLYFIVAEKWIKGAILLLTAAGIFSLAGREDLGDTFDQFVHWIHLDPENRFFNSISDWLNTITPENVRVVATGTLLYGMFLLVGGTGLALRAKWAIWLAIGESAFFIPIEIFELVRRLGSHVRTSDEPHVSYPNFGLFLVLVINIIIVWYLLKNRRRLFRQHR